MYFTFEKLTKIVIKPFICNFSSPAQIYWQTFVEIKVFICKMEIKLLLNFIKLFSAHLRLWKCKWQSQDFNALRWQSILKRLQFD